MYKKLFTMTGTNDLNKPRIMNKTGLVISNQSQLYQKMLT